jgi:hypothetical protein
MPQANNNDIPFSGYYQRNKDREDNVEQCDKLLPDDSEIDSEFTFALPPEFSKKNKEQK